MSARKRKKLSGEFKTKVALEAICGVTTRNKIAPEFGVHPTQVGLWKKALREQAAGLFDARCDPKPVDQSASPERLNSEIGCLKLERDWLKRSLRSACRRVQVLGQHS